MYDGALELGGADFTLEFVVLFVVLLELDPDWYVVVAVAILCQDERVFESMIQAGTPCPIDGKIGKEAQALWSKYDHERPDYKTYVKRMDDRKKIDEEEIKLRAKKEAELKEQELKNIKNVR